MLGFLKLLNLFFERKNVISKLHFPTKSARNSCQVGKNVSIYNNNVHVGSNVKIFDGVILWGDGEIIIKDNVKIGFNTIIYAHKGAGVYIGDNTIVAGNNYIIDTNHHTEVLNAKLDNPLASNDTYEKITIGENVWIAANCVVAKGAILSDCCIIGANSFVNKVIPKNAIAVGSPAKVIRYRGE